MHKPESLALGGRGTDTYKGNLSNPQTQNLYSYTGNNPVNRKDPSGNSWIKDLFKEAFGGIGKAIVGGVKNSGIIKQPTIADIKDIAFNTLFMPENNDSKELAAAKIVTGKIVKDISEELKDAENDIKNELKEDFKDSVKESITELPSKAWKSINEWAAKKIISSIFDKENLSEFFTKIYDGTKTFLESSAQKIYETLTGLKQSAVIGGIELGKKAFSGLLENIVLPVIAPMAQEVFGLFAYKILPAFGTVFGRQLLSAGGYILGESARGLLGVPQALRDAFAPMREDAKKNFNGILQILGDINKNFKRNKNSTNISLNQILLSVDSSTAFLILGKVNNTMQLIKDGREVIVLISNIDDFGFDILRSGKYAYVYGSNSVIKNYNIYGRRYVISNADEYLDVWKYVDGSSSIKAALKSPETYIFMGIGTLLDIAENIDKNATEERIVSDAVFDIGYGLGSTALFSYFGGFIGSFTSPGIGTAVGFIVGASVDMILCLSGLDELAKDFFYRELLKGEFYVQYKYTEK